MKIGLIAMLAWLPTIAAAQTVVLPPSDTVMAVVTRDASAEMMRQKAGDARHHTASSAFSVAVVRLDKPDVTHTAATDGIAAGDITEALYAQDGQADTLAPLRRRLDATLPTLTRASKRPAWGCRALFLTPAVYARMSVLTGDPKYLQAMDMAWRRATQGHRACGGDRATDMNDNGAAIAGLARILDILPDDFPSRPRYVAQYQAMAAALITLQGPHGQWRPALLDTAVFLPGQTSGTAMAAYALAFGLNHGLLDRQTYLPSLLRAWTGLNRDIGPDGLIDGGADTSGAFILAGLEIAKLEDPQTPLPTPIVIRASEPAPPPTERPAVDATSAWRETQAHPAPPSVAPDPVSDDPSERSPLSKPSLPASPK